MLDEAIAKAKERAQERREGCRRVAHNREWAGRSNLAYDPQLIAHTCHDDLAVICDCMLAAAECKLGSENAKRCIGTSGGPNDKDCEACVKAEINRQFGLLKGAKDATK